MLWYCDVFPAILDPVQVYTPAVAYDTLNNVSTSSVMSADRGRGRLSCLNQVYFRPVPLMEQLIVMLFSALTVASTVLSPINCGITERRKGEGGRVGEREGQKLKENLTLLM